MPNETNERPGDDDRTETTASARPVEERTPLDARKATILRAVVAEHIATAQPVGSGLLSGATGLGVSSATIRNEMSALERDGFLTHPHTSAGRIPTDRGYRFYVDSLQSPGRLPGPKLHQIRQFFDSAHGELEQLLTETSRLLSNLTDYAAVVVRPAAEAAAVRSVQIVGLGTGPQRESGPTTVALVVVVLGSGSVEKATIEIPGDVGDQHLGAASAHLSAYAFGRTVLDLAEGRGAALLPTGDHRTDTATDVALRAITAIANDGDPAGVFVGGASRMASAFETVDTIRRVLATLEEQFVVVSLLREALDRSASVSIGTEHANEQAFESLLTCSVVVAPYLVDGRPAGTIGVLGPTRMDYPQAMAAVNLVSEGLTERLHEG